MDYLPRHKFRKCVKRYRGNYKVKSFSCLGQFLGMAFAQLTYRESLREIEVCLRSRQNELFHMGIRGRASRNTLARANEARDWRIYADFAQVLINHARGLYADEDFAQTFRDDHRGPSFSALKAVFTDVISAFRQARFDNLFSQFGGNFGHQSIFILTWIFDCVKNPLMVSKENRF